MRAIILAALVAAVPAFAAPTFKTQNVTVTLNESACPKQVADLIRDEFVPQFRSATVVFGGKVMLACWTLQGDTVSIVDQEGDSGTIPMAQFKNEQGL